MSSKDRRIIFHHPRPIGEKLTTGSRVRPLRMLRAFEALGFQVELIDGYSQERRGKFKKLTRLLAEGAHYDFCYAENAPSPYALTDPDHLPRATLLEWRFFKLMREHNIPTGVFYRDIYWRFPVFKREHPFWVRLLSYPFYHFDLASLHSRNIKTLFLPSVEMGSHFPSNYSAPPVIALPPGCSPDEQDNASDSFLRKAIYVGGVLPPLYDLSPLFQLMRMLPEWSLTIVCRENERRQTNDLYPWLENPNIKVEHASGDQVQKLLSEANVFFLMRQADPYIAFAMPVKIFEAMGAGLPILSNQHDSAGQLIESEEIGWVLPEVDKVADALRGLDSDSWRRLRDQVLSARINHTWERRAQTVVEALSTDR